MNLRFFTDEQKTESSEQLAVKNNIEALIHCKHVEETYELNGSSIEPIYNKYDIHDYAYELYGIQIYKYIDHPEGYLYDELLMPPEFKNMTFSKYFIKYKKKMNKYYRTRTRINTRRFVTRNQVDSADEFSQKMKRRLNII